MRSEARQIRKAGWCYGLINIGGHNFPFFFTEILSESLSKTLYFGQI